MKVQLPKDKYFYIKTKEEMVEAMREPVKSALRLTLDQLIEAINRAGGDVEEKKEDEDPAISNYRNSLNVYQGLLERLTNNQELSLFDFDLITLICKNTSILMDNQIAALKEASKELSKIAWKIAHLDLGTEKVKEVISASKNLTETEN